MYTGIPALQMPACSYANYVKRQCNCNLIATSFKHHMHENVAITTNLHV